MISKANQLHPFVNRVLAAIKPGDAWLFITQGMEKYGF